MPLASFPGRHGWGYDGVGLYAVHEPYGGPFAFRRFVDACHERGLGVCLDVVYNHLGPSGNHLREFGPYFTDRYGTPWGEAVNLDGPGSDEVRRFMIDNALMWLRDFHVDALRLDAVHALFDERAITLLEELTAEADALSAQLGRPLTLIAESDRNDPLTVTPRDRNGTGFHGQWADDVHHALHVALTGETQGYYADFATPGALTKVLEGIFLHDGCWSAFRERTHGAPIDRSSLPGSRFVVSLQTHDQVGNRAIGDRLSAELPPGRLACGAALLLTSAGTPMLFMGEEWGASTPWMYFTDHTDPAIADAVRQGRREEFGGHGWALDDVPDPQARRDVRALAPRLGRARPRAARAPARVVPRPDRRSVASGPTCATRGSIACGSSTTPPRARWSSTAASTSSSSTSRPSRARSCCRAPTWRSCSRGIRRRRARRRANHAGGGVGGRSNSGLKRESPARAAMTRRQRRRKAAGRKGGKASHKKLGLGGWLRRQSV